MGPEHARPPRADAREGETVIPVAKEELEISTREVETGRVRVTKRVRESEERFEQPLRHDEVDIERVPINREIAEPVEVRYDGDVLVIPVIEEVAVVHKQLVLKEELRVRRRSVQSVHEGRVVLRTEEAIVERSESRDLTGDG
jgi:uncharacterized protein (TIGR02271 family)